MADDKMIMEAKGQNGQLQFPEDRIRIGRKSLRAFVYQGLKGDKDMMLSQISSMWYSYRERVKGGQPG